MSRRELFDVAGETGVGSPVEPAGVLLSHAS